MKKILSVMALTFAFTFLLVGTYKVIYAEEQSVNTVVSTEETVEVKDTIVEKSDTISTEESNQEESLQVDSEIVEEDATDSNTSEDEVVSTEEDNSNIIEKIIEKVSEVINNVVETVSNVLVNKDITLYVGDGNIATIDVVEKGVTYIAPQNSQVKVKFTKLPEHPGSLSIEEVTLTDEQVQTLGALSNIAYDITSNMENGTFEYNLELPRPEGAEKDSQVVYAESVEKLDSSNVISENKVDIKSDIVKVEDLNHFTIYVVVKPIPADGAACIAQGATAGSNCYDTIQAAIDAASNGDIILVKAGIYNESLIINKSINLRGAQYGVDPRLSTGSSRNSINSNESVVVASSSKKVINITSNNVVVDGFTFKHEGIGGSDIIKAESSQVDITISNNILLNAADEAIQLEAGTDYVISNNYIIDPVGDGITVSTYAPLKGNNIKIIDNNITGSKSAYGSIYLYGSQNIEVINNLITTRQSGIALGTIAEPVKNIVIKNNTINTDLYTAFSALATGVGIDGNSDNILIEGNNIKQVEVLDTGENTFPDRFNIVRVGVDPNSKPTNIIIKNNNMYKVLSQNYIYVGSGVTNNVVAKNNWWNASTTPENKINKLNLVDFDPWLCEQAPTNYLSVNGICEEQQQDPEIVKVDAYFWKDTYKGIGIDFKTNNLVDAIEVKAEVFRENGDPIVKTNKETGSILNILNTGNLASITLPIVIQQGTYNEAGSSSWNQPTGLWNSTNIPTKIVLTITRSNNQKLVKEILLSEISTNKATLSEVMPSDNTYPDFAILSPLNNSYVNGVITIDAEVKDSSGITKLLMNIGGQANSWTNGNSSTITKVGDVFSRTIDTNLINDGAVYVVLRATDGAGNTRYWNNNAAHRQHVFYVDNTIPEITVKDDFVGSKTAKTFSNVSFKLHDTNKIDKYTINGVEVDLTDNEWSDANFDNFKQHLVQGENTFVLYDVAGNTATYVFTYSTNQIPVATIDIPTLNSYVSTKANGNKLKVTGTFTDDKAVNYLQLELVYKGNLLTVYTMHYSDTGLNSNGTFSIGIPVSSNLVDGEYSLIYTPTDFQDGIGPRLERKFIIDNTKPEITASDEDDVNPASITLTATDAGSGINKITGNIYKYDSDTSTTSTLFKSNSTSTANPFTVNLTGLPDGHYYVKYNASDKAGNISSTKQFEFIVVSENNGGDDNEGGDDNSTTTPSITPTTLASTGVAGGGLAFTTAYTTPSTTLPQQEGRVLGATTYQFTQDLKFGSVHDEVLALQKFLNLKGFTVATSGAGSLGNETRVFGPKTKAALIKYQEANPVILTNVGIMNGKGTGNFFWSTRGFMNEYLLTDSEISAQLEN